MCLYYAPLLSRCACARSSVYGSQSAVSLRSVSTAGPSHKPPSKRGRGLKWVRVHFHKRTVARLKDGDTVHNTNQALKNHPSLRRTKDRIGKRKLSTNQDSLLFSEEEGVRGCPPPHGSLDSVLVKLLFVKHGSVLIGGLFFFAREDFPHLRDLRYLQHLEHLQHLEDLKGYHMFSVSSRSLYYENHLP